MNPASRPVRTDLPYLRRRYRPPAPVTPPAPVATGSTSLSLAPPESALPPPVPGAPPERRTAPTRLAHVPARTRPGTRTILTRQAPTVTLTRIQSGVGVLTLEPVRSGAIADLRLGCAYRLRSGFSSVLYNVGTPTTAPPQATRPVILREPGRQETFTLDLTQSRDLDRLVVFAFSGAGTPPAWGVTLVATTFGQARIEIPLERLPPQRVVVLMSLYNIAGEFVLRAELDPARLTGRTRLRRADRSGCSPTAAGPAVAGRAGPDPAGRPSPRSGRRAG
jgi:hypothetical protein